MHREKKRWERIRGYEENFQEGESDGWNVLQLVNVKLRL